MANSASVSIGIDLKAFAEGLKVALRMGSEFGKAFEQAIHGKLTVDTSGIDAALNDYEKKIQEASGTAMDIDTSPATAGVQKVAAETKRTADTVKSSTLQMAANWGMVLTGVNALIGMMSKAMNVLKSFGAAATEAETANIGLAGAMQKGGIYTDEAFAALDRYIDAVQSATGKDDEMQKANLSAALQMHNFSQKEIPAVIRAAIGLTERGADMKMAFESIAKSAEGVPVRLSTLGIKMKAGEDGMAKYSAVLAAGEEGFKTAAARMDGLSGALTRNALNWSDVKQAIGLVMIDTFQPLLNMISSLGQLLKDHTGFLRGMTIAFLGLVTGIGSYIVIAKSAALATTIWMFAQGQLNMAMKANVIGAIVGVVIALIVWIDSIVKSMGGWTLAWKTLDIYAQASITIVWEYLKAFWEFVKNFGIGLGKLLIAPFTMMWKMASEVLERIGRAMKKLFSGDFKGLMQEFTAGFTNAITSVYDSTISSFEKSFSAFGGMGTKAAGIWAAAARAELGLMATTGKGSGQTQSAPAGAGGGEGEADTSRADAIAAYYEEVKFADADYYNWKLKELEASKKDFIRVTGDEAKANALYIGQKKDLDTELKDWYIAQDADREAAVAAYYDAMKFQADGYMEFMISRYQIEADKYAETTGNKAQAEELYQAKILALVDARKTYQDEIFSAEVTKERSGFETRRAQLDAYLVKLENWKQLGINVAADLSKTWDEYHDLLKSQQSKSLTAYNDALSGKTEATAEQIEVLKVLYENDKDAYLVAVDKRKQAELRALDEIRDRWRENHKFMKASLDGFGEGFNTVWGNMRNHSIGVIDNLKLGWKSMTDSIYSSVGKMASNYIQKEIETLLIHQSVETAKTTATVGGEATRSAVVKSSLLSTIALETWAGLKYVAIQTYKIGASILAWFAKTLGPFAVPATLGTMGVFTAFLAKFRNGFLSGGPTGEGNPNEVAGVVHKGEYVFESGITKGNLKELSALRNLMQRGFRLSDILSGVNIAYAPVPRVAQMGYAGGGYVPAGSDPNKVLSQILAVLQGGVTANMNFSRRELSLEADRGRLERKTL